MKNATFFIFSVILAVLPLAAAHQGDEVHALIVVPYPMHHAAVHDNDAEVKSLLDSGADVRTKDNLGRTALHVAAGANSATVAALLIANNANVNEKINNTGTALHLSAYNNATETVALLLANGADINIKDNLGNTALDVAVVGNAAGAAAILRNYTPGQFSHLRVEKVEESDGGESDN